MNMQNLFRLSSALLVAVLLSACQTTPSIDPDDSASTITPNQLTAETDIGQEYAWGGKILQVQNNADSTEITVLAYPMDSNKKPRFSDSSSGRFIAVYPGYLEPIDYSSGNGIIAVGNLSGFRGGKVSGADYRFPLLQVDDLQRYSPRKGVGRIPFSIGVGIGL